MGAIANTLSAEILNATLPTATGGKPTATFWTAGGLSTAGAMYIRLNSTSYSNGSAEGTQLASGGGYTTNGATLGASATATAVSNVETVYLPAAATSWTNSSGSAWSISSLDITDNSQVWAWYGNWNGAPISVANGNTFSAAASACTVTLS
jgi:hypothetical protein